MGFYCMFDPQAVGGERGTTGPPHRRLVDHLEANPVPGGPGRALHPQMAGNRRRRASVGRSGRLLAGYQAVLHGAATPLPRVYLTVRDFAPYAAVAQELGFQAHRRGSVVLDGDTYYSAALDFGPDSVDGGCRR